MNFFTETMFYKFLKFAAVGFSGVVVDFGVTYLCKEILKIQKFVSNAIGFCLAATTNYILNRIWTFESHNPKIGGEFLKFFCISLIGLGLNLFILWILHSKFKWNFWFSKLCAIGIVTIWNFLANAIYTFAIV